MTRLASAVISSVASRRRMSSPAQSRCSTASPSWFAGSEIPKAAKNRARGSSRAATRRAVAANVDRSDAGRRARDVFADPGLLPGFPDDRIGEARAGSDASADEIVEQPGVDRLGRAAAREPHPPAIARADQAIGVRGKGMDPEVARGGTLQLEQRRGVQAPPRPHSARRATPSARPPRQVRARPLPWLRCARAGCPGLPLRTRRRAHRAQKAPRPAREPSRARGRDPAHNALPDPERFVRRGRCGEHARQAIRHRATAAGEAIHCARMARILADRS